MNEKRIKLLGEAPVTKAIMTMALPVIMGMMVNVLYNLVDLYFVGRLNDPNQIAAVNISLPIFMIMMALAAFVGSGSSSYISRSIGNKNEYEANKTLNIGIYMVSGIAIVLTILGLLFLTPIVNALGASSATFSFTKSYVQILLIGSIPIMVNYAIGQMLRSEGDAMGSVNGMLIGTVTNIILDPILILIMGLGVQGAAVATVAGNIMALLYYILRYASGKTILKIKPSLFSFDKIIWKEIITIGVPASLTQILMSVSLIFANNIAAGYSDNLVAAFGISSKIVTIGTFIFMGLAAGSQPLIGYNYGAANYERVNAIVKKGLQLTVSIGGFLLILFLIIAPWAVSIFSTDNEVLSLGSQVLRRQIFSLPFAGGIMLLSITVQAMGKAKQYLFLSISRQGLLYIPILFSLNSFFGMKGFILTKPFTDIVMFFIAFLVYRQLDLSEAHQKKTEELGFIISGK